MNKTNPPIPPASAPAVSGAMLSPQVLAERILVIRGQRVLLDADLAQLYEVETRVFNQAVKRNSRRFPADFMFQLSADEFENLISQSVTSRWGGRRKLPLAFTEHGAIMAASVLNSDRAVEMSVYVVRAFVQLRAVLLDHKVLAEKLAALERRVSHHDNSLAEVIDAIRALMAQPKPANRPIGFTADLSMKSAER
ncbi:ORF6N domain-containing protein [Polaromonas sp. A23]|uniref:ORF6N domain-containing protein n=1 Tax=Polaromonas sp. A23 TaxID=1944133 RepID=UPI0020C4A4C2|nr:ORF6N domain-containing protein [Polaromonas sp. A23]